MRRFSPFGLIQPAILAVIVVQPAELQPRVFHRSYEPKHFVLLSLFDSGAIHAGIYVDEDADRGASPLPHLFFILGQYGNADVRELICDFDARGVHLRPSPDRQEGRPQRHCGRPPAVRAWLRT